MKNPFLKLIVLAFLLLPIQKIAYCQPTDSIIAIKKINTNNSLNSLSVGYQIGGVTFVGAEYEYRFSKGEFQLQVSIQLQSNP